jgi:hypothetical protein
MLEFVELRSPGARERVLARLPAETRDYLLSCPTAGWIPIELDRNIPAAMLAEFGRAEMLAIYRASLSYHVRSPLLNGLLESMLRLLGISMASAGKLYVRGFKAAYRDMAEPSAELLGPRHLQIVLDDIAEAAIDHEGYLTSFEGIMLGLFEVANEPGGTLDFTVDRRARRIVADLRW